MCPRLRGPNHTIDILDIGRISIGYLLRPLLSDQHVDRPSCCQAFQIPTNYKAVDEGAVRTTHGNNECEEHENHERSDRNGHSFLANACILGLDVLGLEC